MRQDAAARALRVDDDWAELRSVGSLLDVELPESMRRADAAAPDSRTVRRFERSPAGAGAASVVALADPPAEIPRRFAREAQASPPSRSRGSRARVATTEPDHVEPAAAAPAPEPVSLPRTAPGRSYGSHRRGEAPVRIAGVQPGRRTVEITGQAIAPRRRPSQTSAALVAKPDRVALWAFLFALFLLAMAVATAHG